MNRAKKYDVVITHDIGLASILVKKGVFVLSPRGKLFTETEMDTVLHIRYAMAKERRNGQYAKGPKPFSVHDKLYFTKRLHQILSNLAGKINEKEK
jgi:uncharacterized protein